MVNDPPERDAVRAAQDIIYDAWELNDRRRRVALARKALKVSPLCADAYVLLARETARNLDEAIDFYVQGLEAGEKALGKAAFRDDVGLFWGILETRPYMRARHGLAQALWDKGLRDEAVEHYQEMLRLNPNDNQGIRYPLIDCLLALLGSDERERPDSSSGTRTMGRQPGVGPARCWRFDEMATARSRAAHFHRRSATTRMSRPCCLATRRCRARHRR